jgi:hypothetical protein
MAHVQGRSLVGRDHSYEVPAMVSQTHVSKHLSATNRVRVLPVRSLQLFAHQHYGPGRW